MTALLRIRIKLKPSPRPAYKTGHSEGTLGKKARCEDLSEIRNSEIIRHLGLLAACSCRAAGMHHLHFIVNFTMCRPRSCSTSTIESKVQNLHTSEPNAMPPAAPPRGKLKLNPERKREVEMEEGVSE